LKGPYTDEIEIIISISSVLLKGFFEQVEKSLLFVIKNLSVNIVSKNRE